MSDIASYVPVPSPDLCKEIPEGCFRYSFLKACREWGTDGSKLPFWTFVPASHAVLTADKNDIESIYNDGHTPVYDMFPAPMLKEIIYDLGEPEAEIVIRFNTDGTATVSYHKVGQDKIYVQVSERLEDAALNIWFLVNNNNNKNNKKEEKR